MTWRRGAGYTTPLPFLHRHQYKQLIMHDSSHRIPHVTQNEVGPTMGKSAVKKKMNEGVQYSCKRSLLGSPHFAPPTAPAAPAHTYIHP